MQDRLPVARVFGLDRIGTGLALSVFDAFLPPCRSLPAGPWGPGRRIARCSGCLSSGEVSPQLLHSGKTTIRAGARSSRPGSPGRQRGRRRGRF